MAAAGVGGISSGLIAFVWFGEAFADRSVPEGTVSTPPMTVPLCHLPYVFWILRSSSRSCPLRPVRSSWSHVGELPQSFMWGPQVTFAVVLPSAAFWGPVFLGSQILILSDGGPSIHSAYLSLSSMPFQSALVTVWNLFTARTAPFSPDSLFQSC